MTVAMIIMMVIFMIMMTKVTKEHTIIKDFGQSGYFNFFLENLLTGFNFFLENLLTGWHLEVLGGTSLDTLTWFYT